jgi:hypothetical protein
MPVRERSKEVLLAVMVEVYRPPSPNVLEVEDDVERPRCALQELQDLIPGRPRNSDILASNANHQMGTPQLFPRHYRSLAAAMRLTSHAPFWTRPRKVASEGQTRRSAKAREQFAT